MGSESMGRRVEKIIGKILRSRTKRRLREAIFSELLAVSTNYLQKKGAELQGVQGESLNELRKQGFQRRINHHQ